MLLLGVLGKFLHNGLNSIGAKVIGTVGSDEKVAIAKKNGYAHVINYSKNDFAKRSNEDLQVIKVFQQFLTELGKKHLKVLFLVLNQRGMMVSFGNASGPLEPIDVTKDIQSKSLFFTRPAGGHYFTR